LGSQATAEINVADLPPDSLYLTVTGTSAKAGDDSEAGRGNRTNGLITPYRPMTMESVAGKNPVNHVGKLYNLAAGLIAESLVTNVRGLTAVECFLVSRFGQEWLPLQVSAGPGTDFVSPSQPNGIELDLLQSLSKPRYRAAIAVDQNHVGRGLHCIPGVVLAATRIALDRLSQSASARGQAPQSASR